MASASERLLEDISAARKLYADVEAISADGECISFRFGGEEFTVVLQGSYGEECTVYGPNDYEASCAGSIVDVIGVVLQGSGDRVADAMDDEDDEDDDVADAHGFDMSVASRASAPPPEVAADILQLAAYGIGCTVNVCVAGEARLTLALPLPGEISWSTAEAWGLDRDRPLYASLSIGTQHYWRDPSQRLDVDFFQEKTVGGVPTLAAGRQLSNIAKTFWRHLSGMGAQTAQPCLGTRVSDRLVAKQAAALSECLRFEGVLLPLARYMTLRLPCLHEFCVICDEPLVFPPLLQPAVCTRELCSYSLRVFGDAIAGEFAKRSVDMEVWDLLAAMAICAGRMPEDRMAVLFDGDYFPALFLPGSSVPAFRAGRDGLQRLRGLLRMLEDRRNKSAKDLGIGWLHEVGGPVAGPATPDDELLPQLLLWLWDSNRSYLTALSEETRIQALQTPLQYLLLSAPPEQEEAFQKLKLQHGSDFCFHGSPPANWHCILRQGLKNASGTSLMTSGQAHGPGIYLARDSSTSAGYSGRECRRGGNPPPGPAMEREVTGERLHDPDSFSMLAICEVAQVPSLKKCGNVWVCRQEAAVVTRLFLVYQRSEIPQLDLADAELDRQLVQLVRRMRDG